MASYGGLWGILTGLTMSSDHPSGVVWFRFAGLALEALQKLMLHGLHGMTMRIRAYKNVR